MVNAADGRPRQRRSFKTRLMLLVALAVVLPALSTCLILGIQLNRQARNLFANGLEGNLETFALVLQDAERNVSEGLTRMASDNTLQVTLDLGMTSQLNKYIEAQREVLGVSFVAVFDANSHIVAFSEPTRTQRWGGGGSPQAAKRVGQIALWRASRPSNWSSVMVRSISPRQRRSLKSATRIWATPVNRAYRCWELSWADCRSRIPG